MKVKNLHTVNLRFPGQGSSSQGKSGPKPRPNRRRRWKTGLKFLYQCQCDGVTQEAKPAHCWCGSKRRGVESRKIRAPLTLKRDGERRLRTKELVYALLPRKASKLQLITVRTAIRHR